MQLKYNIRLIFRRYYEARKQAETIKLEQKYGVVTGILKLIDFPKAHIRKEEKKGISAITFRET